MADAKSLFKSFNYPEKWNKVDESKFRDDELKSVWSEFDKDFPFFMIQVKSGGGGKGTKWLNISMDEFNKIMSVLSKKK